MVEGKRGVAVNPVVDGEPEEDKGGPQRLKGGLCQAHQGLSLMTPRAQLNDSRG